MTTTKTSRAKTAVSEAAPKRVSRSRKVSGDGLFRKPTQQLTDAEYTARYNDDRNWTGLGSEGGLSKDDNENLARHMKLEGKPIREREGKLYYGASRKELQPDLIRTKMAGHWSQIKNETRQRFQGEHMVEAMEAMYIALMFGMNAYVEGSSGIGKTAAMRFLCKLIDAPFAELQASADLSDLHIRGDIIPVSGMKYALDRGPMLTPGAVGIFVDEFPRIPSTTTNVFLESMEFKQCTLSVPGREEASHTVLLSRNFFVMGAGNPRGYGGQGERSLALWDRFRIGYNMHQPDSDARQQMYTEHQNSAGRHMLAPREEGRDESVQVPPGFTFREVQAAASKVRVPDDLRLALGAAAFAMTPKNFAERCGWETCGAYTAITTAANFSRKRRAALDKLRDLVEENLIEGSNPRGELAIIDNARALRLMDQRTDSFDVNRTHMRKALAYGVRSRLKTYPGCEGSVEEIIELTNTCFFPVDSR
ncbi:MAG: MoxR family ATPase [Planctomycetota bacterium]